MLTGTRKEQRPFKVVVIEDCSSDVQMILEGLQKDGRELRVLVLSDGQKASDHFDDEGPSFDPFGRPDLILLDLNLPRKNGADLIVEIKSKPRLQGVPLVIFSGSEHPAEIWRCYDLGANLVVPKPMEPKPFIALVQAIEHYCLDMVGPRAAGILLHDRPAFPEP